MHKFFVPLFATMMVLASHVVMVQAGVETCSPADISLRADEMIAQYQTARMNAIDTDAALAELETLQGQLRVLQTGCSSQVSELAFTALTSANIRKGPGTNFGLAGNLPAKQTGIAVGRNADSTWLQTSIGWIFARLVSIDGDIEQLPVTSQSNLSG